MKANTQQFLPIDSRVAQIDLDRVFQQVTRGPSPSIPVKDWPAAELEYRRFLTLKVQHPHQLLVPGGRCLRLWQAHILDTRAYRDACYAAFGRVIDHFPHLALGGQAARQELASAKRDYRRAVRLHFALARKPATGQVVVPADGAVQRAKLCRRMVLVALPWHKDADDRLPLGHASMLAALEEVEGVEVLSIVRSVNTVGFSAAHVASEILRATFGMPDESVSVGLGAYVWNDEAVREILRALRERGFRGRIILGGPQVTYMTESPERLYPEVDVFVRGQGESALCQLVSHPGRSSIQGVQYAGSPYSDAQAPSSFESLPSPWISGVLPIEQGSQIRWETQRGCNFRCSFCQHRQPGKTNQIVRRSMDRLENEIDKFCAAKVRRISVLDPMFNVDDEHATSVLQAFADRGFDGEISLQCRAEFVTERFLDVAEKLHAHLEFGLQSIRQDECSAIGRRNNLKTVERVLGEVKRRNIRHEVSVIYGLPVQSLASFKETVAWCLEREAQVIKAFPLLLLRGTPLEAERERWKFSVRSDSLPMVTASEGFSESDWLKMEKIADALARTEGRHPATLEALLGDGAAVPDARASAVRTLGRG